MQELARTRYIAEQYANLQGFTGIPLGLLCLGLFLLGVGWLILPGMLLLWGVSITVALTIGAIIFYQLAYGRTRPLRRVQRRDALFAIGMGLVLASAFILDPLLQPRVDLVESALAAGLLLYYWPHRRFAVHYLLIAIIIVAISLLPLFGGSLDYSLMTCTNSSCAISLSFGNHVNLLSQSISAILMRFFLSYAILGIAGGLCDHLLLSRAFTPAK